MGSAAICRIAGGLLVLLAGIAIGVGGFQLWRGGASAWPDVIAHETTVKRTAAGMIALAVLLLIAAAAAMANLPWGGIAAASATIVVVVGAFWANQLLFGAIRPLHTITNVVVAAIILALLWFGSFGRAQ